MTQPRYLEPLPLGADGVPYSKGLMARALIAVGVGHEPAYDLARRIESDLAARGVSVVDLDRVGELAADVLGDEAGAGAVRRLRRLRALQQLDVPIILLVGGATGTGKSTVATEAAHRLGITRVTSTDFVRQTMRAFFSTEFIPSIHASSFEAGSALGVEPIGGFLEQTRNVLVGVRALLDRAMQEGWSMVLEGVHLLPGLVPERIEGALVVHCVLAIEDESVHEAHFWVRDATSEGLRPVQKYVDALGDIRTIQTAIVSLAHEHAVPVVENRTMEAAIAEVMELVFAGAERIEGEIA